MSTDMGMSGQTANLMSTSMGMNNSRPRDDGGTYVGPASGSQVSDQPPQQQWSLPQWSPQQPIQTPMQNSGNPAGMAVGESQFYGGAPDMFKKDAYKDDDEFMEKYLATMLPVATYAQNNEQYRNDFNEAQRRWNTEHGQTQQRDQFQQGLSTRQQQSAEEQARIAAGQWNQQMDWTKQTDQWGNQIANRGLDIQGREVDNTGQYQRGLVSNQGMLNQAQQQYWMGQNKNDQFANQATANYQQGLNQNQQFANKATAQYQQGLIGNQGFANNTDRMLGQQANNIDQQYKRGLISNEQRNMALQELTQQQNNSFLYSQMAQQAQQAQLDRENMMRMTSMQTYGRAQAPSANWSRSWS
jgi:hypothetical protein